MTWHKRRWYWGERFPPQRIWFTSFEDTLIPPIPVKGMDSMCYWQQEIYSEEKLSVDFEVYFANRKLPSSRDTQDDDFTEHIMNMYKHTMSAQTLSHRRLTSNSLVFQTVCLVVMWFCPTKDFLPCSMPKNHSLPLKTIGGNGETITSEIYIYNDKFLQNYETTKCQNDQVEFGVVFAFLNQCDKQTEINTWAWHCLNLCSVWTAVRAMWVQGLFGLTHMQKKSCSVAGFSLLPAGFAQWSEGFFEDPLTYFIALMQIVGAICYVVFVVFAWPSVRCTADGGTLDCINHCNLQNHSDFLHHTSDFPLGSRILEETSVVFALLAMFCRVCRDVAVDRGLWNQRWSIGIPFALLMLHSLVTQNSLIIIIGVTTFVAATFFSASIGKF